MTDGTRNTYRNTEEESSISLAELWQLIWDNKSWYIISVVICLIVAAFYLYRTPATYVRSAKVLIDESTQDATMRNLGVASAGMMRLRSFNSVENEIEAFSSPDLMQTVVQRLGLETRYVEQQPLRDVELYKNSPVEMRLAGDNPQSAFSLEVAGEGDDMIALYDFRVKKERIKD